MKTNIQISNQNMNHRNQNKTHKHTYDHYEKYPWIRAMIYMIAKPNMRTQRYKSISNMGVSNTNHACHRTIIMAFIILIMKQQNMLNMNKMKACKQ